MIWTIAFRNLLKNARRSTMTALAIGIGGLAALLFGGFVTSIWFGVQTAMIQDQGNIQIYRDGYLEFGAANPDDYTILNWPSVVELISSNKGLSDEISIITPRINLAGVAGNAVTGNSKTFIGSGIVPSQVDQMRSWDGWNINQVAPLTGLSDDVQDGVVVGLGMARMMGVCEPLNVADCKDRPSDAAADDDLRVETDFSSLVDDETALTKLREQQSGQPQLNLMAATSSGVPNIARVSISSAQPQAVRALDNAYIMMHFEQARELLYGDSQEATVLMLQIKNPDRADAVKAQLQSVLDGSGLDLNVYHFTEVDPTFDRVFGMFTFLFIVISIVLSIVIIFTITNTVSMTVVERVKEIGTIRALGFRKSFVRYLFLAESALIGLFGATIALIMAIVLSSFVNSAGIQWTPPSNATPLTVQLMVLENPQFTFAVVLALVLITVLASILPTFKASRLNIVESLQRA